MNTSRRDFLTKVGTISLCTCTGLMGINACSMIKGISEVPLLPDEAFTYSESELTVDLSKTSLLDNVGNAAKTSVSFANDELKLIIIQNDNDNYVVFSDKCAHGGRELNYLDHKKILQCSSFGHSEYNLDGQVLKGPAKNPLSVYIVKKENQLLRISLV